MPSEIYIKQNSTTWKKALSIKIRRSTGWTSAKRVWLRFSGGWQRIWPTSGVFNITSPFITTSVSGSTPLYGESSVVRIGTTYYGRRGTWDPNGFSISSYNYLWPYYSTGVQQDTYDELGNIGSGVFADPSNSLTISGTSVANLVDGKFISFRVTANASNSLYSSTADSKDEYGKVKVVRRTPQLTSASISGNTTVGSTLSFGSAWDTSEAYKPVALRSTIKWYRSDSATAIYSGGARIEIASGVYQYTIVQADLGKYIVAEETTFNTGSDYDIGVNLFTNGLNQVTRVTSIITAGLTGATSTSVSVSRLNNTTTRAVVGSSGASGPYYQLYWQSGATAPTTSAYDAASTTSTVTEDFSFANGITYYFYIRSSSENLGNTTTNGTGTAGTFSAYGPSTGAAQFTFAQPSGSVSVSPSSGTAGTTTFTATPSISAAPSAIISYQWQYFEGGSFGYIAISGATSSSYTPPSNYVSIYGSNLRCQITANNGVGTELVATASVTVNAPSTVPGQVTGVTATVTSLNRPYNDGEIGVSWTAPANGGSAITGYKVEYSSNAGASWTSLSDNWTSGTSLGSSPWSVGTYIFRVSAINAIGTGSVSANSNNAVVTTVPQAPTIGAATAGNGTVSVAFTAGATGGSAITGFTVTSSSGNVGTGTSSPISVSDTNGTARTYTVKATNANGSSSASGSVSATPVAPPVTQYTVTWNANGGTGGGSTTQNSGVAHTPPVVTRTGYTFSRWRNPETGGDPIFVNAGSTYTPTASISFWAQWTLIVTPTITTPTYTNVANTTGTINWTSTNQSSYALTGSFTDSGTTGTTVAKTGLTQNTTYSGTITVTSSSGHTASKNYSFTTTNTTANVGNNKPQGAPVLNYIRFRAASSGVTAAWIYTTTITKSTIGVPDPSYYVQVFSPGGAYQTQKGPYTSSGLGGSFTTPEWEIPTTFSTYKVQAWALNNISGQDISNTSFSNTA